MSKYECTICNLTFSNLSNFKRHNKNKHHQAISPKEEPNLDIQRFTFYSDEDFHEWKQKIEQDTCSSFVRRSGHKTRKDDSTIQYYQCHRSGTYTPLQQNRKRNLKASGTIKIGANCPAKVVTSRTVIDCAVEIAVRYVATHVGHSAEPSAAPAPARRRRRTTDRSVRPVPVDAEMATTGAAPPRDPHTLSADIPGDGIVEAQPGVSWIFAATADYDSETADATAPPRLETCEVDRVRNPCEDPEICTAWCQSCDRCLHPYQCSCDEFSVRLLICKHIHRVGQINASHANPFLKSEEEVSTCPPPEEYQLSVGSDAIQIVSGDKVQVLSLEQAVDEALRSEMGTCIVKIPDTDLDARRADLVTKLHSAIDKTRYATTHQQLDILDSLASNMLENMESWQMHFFMQTGVTIPLFMCTSNGQ